MGFTGSKHWTPFPGVVSFGHEYVKIMSTVVFSIT